MARVITAVVATLLLISALWWWQPGRQSETPLPEAAPGPRSAVPTGAQRHVHQPPLLPSAAFDVCDGSPDEEAVAERMEAIEVQQEALLRVLSASPDAEHRLVAALASWSSDQDRALSLLGEAAARDPRHPLIASQILMLCTEVDACGRARPQLERNLIAADRGNAMAWVQVTRSRLQRNDERNGLAALREAAAAATVDEYLPDYVMLFDRGLAAASDLEPFDRMVAAVGLAAAPANDVYMITRDCAERAAHLSEWRDACLRLGERFEHDSLTILAQAVGIRMQADMYELEGDTRAAETAMQRRQDLDDRWLQLGSRTVQAEKLRDATVIRHYFETFDSGGELQAMEYLAAEVESRLPPLSAAQRRACEAP